VTWLERDYERDGAAASGDRRRRVLVTGALGGRFDHEMAHLSCLHAFADTEIVLLGRTSTARLIPKGVTVIVPDAAAEGPTCGLFPMLGPATVSTSGLRWNLDSHVLTFGTNISTSNRIRGVDEEPLDEESLDEKSLEESLDESLDAANDGKHENGARVLRSVRVETDAPLVWTTDATRARRFVAPFVFVAPAETRLEGAAA
jgi:thiamine pyrophosphokinase